MCVPRCFNTRSNLVTQPNQAISGVGVPRTKRDAPIIRERHVVATFQYVNRAH